MVARPHELSEGVIPRPVWLQATSAKDLAGLGTDHRGSTGVGAPMPECEDLTARTLG